MFGGGSNTPLDILEAAGLLGPRMKGGGAAPAPNALFTGPPPDRYDPVLLHPPSKPPSPQ